MTLNGRNKINKNSGAHQKNFNEDRPMSVVAKGRPMHLFVTVYIKCMRISAGVPSWEGASSTISANGLQTNGEALILSTCRCPAAC